ncbi:hypothetical protein [Bradyrhizobium sp. LHD-71]|uniref:hypothetical protein n=1 Tax=Bradyrhizobium sp. LHD-71 TaxID=3072141 RepID=UPI00280EC611|nr:hypothetical protein [Bradyrhizobium sp. LHD-71]MDQ8726648.1 hypothetical protein [Bradyrhizobium sp. LHD-71]
MSRIEIGDPIVVFVNDTGRQAEIVGCSRGSWILARTDDDSLWMEVVVEHSAAAWTRLVLLDRSVSTGDVAHLETIARAVASNPHRKDVSDIAGADHLCAHMDRLMLTSST